MTSSIGWIVGESFATKLGEHQPYMMPSSGCTYSPPLILNRKQMAFSNREYRKAKKSAKHGKLYLMKRDPTVNPAYYDLAFISEGYQR